MLLVHDDQAEALDRREHRRAGADDDVDVRRAGCGAIDRAARRRTGRCAGSPRDRRTAARNDADDRRRQRDFRHEHDDAAARSRDRARQPEIELGLAAAGHAVQQGRREASRLRQSRRAGRTRRAVRPSARARPAGRSPRWHARRVAFDPAPRERDQAELRQPLQHGGRDPPPAELGVSIPSAPPPAANRFLLPRDGGQHAARAGRSARPRGPAPSGARPAPCETPTRCRRAAA